MGQAPDSESESESELQWPGPADLVIEMALLEFTERDAFSELVIEAAQVASQRIQTDDRFFNEKVGNVLRKVALDSNFHPPSSKELADIREKLHCVVHPGADRNSYMQCVRDENKILVNDTVRHL